MTDTETPTALRDLYAAAIALYDHAVGQAADPAPRGHHYGQADAVLAARDRELEQVRQMYAQQSAANAAYRLQIDELISRNADYADRAIANGQRAEKAQRAVDLLAEQYRALEAELLAARSTLDRVRAVAIKRLAADECGEWERHGYHSAMAEIAEALDASA